MMPDKGIHVCIDARIELLSIVLKLSGYDSLHPGRISETPSPYLYDVETYFGKYAGHETIRYFQDINETISGDLPVSIVLYLSEPPDLELQAPFDEIINARVKDGGALNQYVEALRNFAGHTHFSDFFVAHKPYYDALLAGPEKSIEESGVVNLLEGYFGARQPAYFVIFAPLLKSVAFGPRVHRGNGDLNTYCVFPSVGVENDLITFKEGKALQNRILHEFGHSFVNPLVDRHWGELARYALLMRNIVYNTRASYGTEWKVSVYEHVVRAVTTRLTHREYGEEAGRKEMLAHEEQGFIYVKALCNKLVEYERNRDTYPSFADFFPEIINLFQELSEKIVDRQSVSAPPGRADPSADLHQKRTVL